MPKVRLVGNIFVSFLNKFCTGYWSISDPLNGYTALRPSVYNNLDKDNIADKYDLEVSMFNVLYMVDAKVKDVFIPAIYGDEVSDIKLARDTISTTKTLFKGFLYRMWWKNLLFSLSLVPIFYVLGSILLLFSLIYGSWVIYTTLGENVATAGTVLLAVVPFFLGIQFLLQGLVLDIQSEPR